MCYLLGGLTSPGQILAYVDFDLRVGICQNKNHNVVNVGPNVAFKFRIDLFGVGRRRGRNHFNI